MKIRLAYSPDTDDAFMIHPLRAGWLDWEGYEFEFIRDDIETLNQAARQGVYDVTALSLAAYPHVAQHYYLARVGHSVGEGFGPVVAVRKDSAVNAVSDLHQRRILSPGALTTAHLVGHLLLPECRWEVESFDQIPRRLLEDPDLVGILIHERQIDCEDLGLRRVTDLGSLWERKYPGMPLTLGINGIRRSLGAVHCRHLEDLILRSIEYAQGHAGATLPVAMDQCAGGLRSIEEAQRYVGMYANHRSLGVGEDARSSIEMTLDAGVQLGLCPPWRRDGGMGVWIS